MSNEKYREIANDLVKKTTINGKLDLDELRYYTNEKARELAAHDSKWDAAVSSRLASSVVARRLESLTTATREVLGIIPKEKWGHDSGDMLSTAVSTILHKAMPEADYDNGLVCNIPKAGVNPKQSLASQDVSCHKPSAGR